MNAADKDSATGAGRFVGRVLRALADQALAERERWALWVPVCVGLGVAFYFALAREPPWWLGPAVLAVAALGATLGRSRAAVLVPAIALAALALGHSAAQWRTMRVAAPVLEREIGPIEVHGRVVAVEPLPGARRVVLEDVSMEEAPLEAPRRVRIRIVGEEPVLSLGAWIAVRAVLAPASPPSVPGAYDFQRHAFFQGIGAVGYARGAAHLLAPPAGAAERGLAGLWIARLRQAVTARILEHLPGREGAIAAALVTGEQHAVPEPDLKAMRDSGLAHLLSISGLHMGFVVGILFFSMRAALALVPALALAWPIKKWAAGVALAGALFYLFLSGASVPAERSFIMAGLVLAAVMLDRSAISMRLVAWAAFAVLLASPEAVVGPSFQMSFAAVVTLIAAFEATRVWRLARRADAGPLARFSLWAGATAGTSLVATLATAPYAVYHFNRLAGYGIAANMLAVPLTGVWIMPWAVAACLLMPFGLEGLALTPMGWGIEALLAIAGWVAAWPGAVTLVPAMPPVGLALVTLGGLWLSLWERRWRFFGLPLVAAGLATVLLVRPPDLLISEDGKLIALRDDSGRLLLSSARAARFDSEIWLRRAGQEERVTWAAAEEASGGTLACDALGCIYRRGGRVVALASDPGALDEDCRVADLLVSVVPVRRACPSAARVIDRFDLWRDGGHAVWIGRDRIRVQTVGETRGERPWVARPAASAQ